MNQEALEILRDTKAVIENDHFVGTSGRHMSVYVNKDLLMQHPSAIARITELMAQANKDLDVDVVAAPIVGGAILGNWIAYHLSKIKGREILSAYADKTEGAQLAESGLIFKRGYEELIKGKKILAIDDTIATGLSVHKLIDVVQKFGGQLVRLAVFVNRLPGEVTSETLGVPLLALCEIPAETYDPKDCPLCKSGVPVNTKMGHGKKFLAEQKK